jgi:proteic killer suppression protein
MTIKKIKHRGLKKLFEDGRGSGIGAKYQSNAMLIMDYLDAITVLTDCVGVKDFHPLKGNRAGQYAMHVSGNYVITFEWDGKDVTILDFEDYH